MRIAPAITLSPEQRTVLESQARSRSLAVRVAERARIVLFAASGLVRSLLRPARTIEERRHVGLDFYDLLIEALIEVWAVRGQ